MSDKAWHDLVGCRQYRRMRWGHRASWRSFGAIRLIIPAATGVLPIPVDAQVAATALAVLMVLAIVLHARRPDEGRNIVVNVILGAIAALVAYGRFVIAPLSDAWLDGAYPPDADSQPHLGQIDRA